MTRTILLSMGLAVAVPGVILARSAQAGDEPTAAKTPAAKTAAAATPAEPAAPEVTDKAALDDDILAVIALPLAADDARDAGVEAAEVEAAIDAVDAAGGSPADASEVLTAEADATRQRGPKKGFGVWVRIQVADGKHGKELAELIKKKKAEYKEMTEEQKAEVDAKLAKLKDKWIDHRKKLHERRKELIATGKKAVRRGEAELAVLEKKLGKTDKRQKRMEEAIAADPSRKDVLEKLLKKSEKREDRLEDREDKVEDKVDDAEDKLDKAEDRKEKREEKREEIREKIEDAKAAHGKKKHEGKHGEGKGG
jgi:hypothetical protein